MGDILDFGIRFDEWNSRLEEERLGIELLKERIRLQDALRFQASSDHQTRLILSQLNKHQQKPDIEMRYELDNTFTEYNECFILLSSGYGVNKEKMEAFIKQFGQELWDELWDLHTSGNSVILDDMDVEIEVEELLSIGGDVICKTEVVNW